MIYSSTVWDFEELHPCNMFALVTCPQYCFFLLLVFLPLSTFNGNKAIELFPRQTCKCGETNVYIRRDKRVYVRRLTCISGDTKVYVGRQMMFTVTQQ